MARGTVIGSDHLILEGGGKGVGSADLTLNRAIRRHVQLVLDRAGDDRKAAAKLLGITPKELGEHLT